MISESMASVLLYLLQRDWFLKAYLTYEFIIELSSLNNQCSSASLASEWLYWTNLPVLLVSNCFFELNQMPSMSSNVP